jgi:cysteine desulfurase
VPVNSHIAISSIEHPSITEPAIQRKSQDKLSFIPVDHSGLVPPSSLDHILQQAPLPSLVSIMLANNENGVIQDIKGIAQRLNNPHITIHTDATQAVGKIPVSFSDLKVNLMSLSSHKIYGPKGCGALVADHPQRLNPMLMGGGQENGLRSGTENVAAIVGFGKAAEISLAELDQQAEDILKLRQYLEHELKTLSGVIIFSEQVNRLPNTVQCGISGMDGEMLLMQLDKKNIAVSSGSACSSGGGKPSPVLIAMGVEPSLAKSAIRISLGKMNTQEEIKEFITQLTMICHSL